MRISDWSSDVCSSDLPGPRGIGEGRFAQSHATPLPGARRIFAKQFDAVAFERSDHLHQRIDDTANLAIGCFHPLDRGKRKARQFRSEEHTSELQSLMRISYAVFCLKKKNNRLTQHTIIELPYINISCNDKL